MEKNIILFNPSSGQNRALQSREKLEELLKQFNVKYELYVTGSEAHFRELIHKHIKNAKSISAAGGDSSFTILVNEVIKSGINIPVGIIPLGSSDDIAKEFNINSLEDAVRALGDAKVTVADVGKISDKNGFEYFFAGQANVGIGAFVNRYVANYQKNGFLFRKNQTVAGILAMYAAFQEKAVPGKFTLRYNDISITEEFVSLLFSKIKYWATGRLFLPKAEVNDGKIHLLMIRQCGFFRILKIMIQSVGGRHIDRKTVQYIAAESFHLTSGKPFLIQVDGDILYEAGHEKVFHEVRIESLPERIEILSIVLPN